MYYHSHRNIAIVVIAVSAMMLQGCDQINKFVDYLSPDSSKPEIATPAPTPQPVEKPQEAVIQEPAIPAAEAADITETALSKESELAPDELARVGSWSITIDEFEERLAIVKETVPDFDLTNVEQKKLILSELIQQQLLVQEALARKMDQDEAVVAALDDFRNTVLVQALGGKITEGLEVTDEEVETYYNDNPDFFRTLKEWKVREIVVKEEAKAKEILVTLNQGGSFNMTAQAQSISESASSGGDLGYLTIPTGDPKLDVNVFPFEKMMQTVTALEKDGMSGLIQGPDGFYIVKVDDIRGGEIQKLEDIREDLKQYIIATKQQQLLIDTLVEAQEKFNVNINEKLLEE